LVLVLLFTGGFQAYYFLFPLHQVLRTSKAGFFFTFLITLRGGDLEERSSYLASSFLLAAPAVA
jgi:hypothetical protein